MEPREFQPGEVVNCDVCIIGSGAAGLTMGAKFATLNKNLRVVILESSTKDERQKCAPTSLERVRREMTLPADDTCHRYQDNSVQCLYFGSVAGDVTRCDLNFLKRHRIRVFGGTTNCWGGYTRTLQPIDFTRTTIGPGWPIQRKDLDQAYAEAMYYCSLTRDSRALDIPLSAYEDPSWFVGKTDTEIETLSLPGDLPIRSGAFTIISAKENPDTPYDGRLDFQFVWGPAIAKSGNVQVLRNANVQKVGISGGRASHAVVRCLVDGKPDPRVGAVHAKVFVVAAGGIETTRLLMLSGIKSKHLGSGLMVHPLNNWEWESSPLRFVPTGKASPQAEHFYGSPSNTLKDRGYETQVRAVLIPTDDALKANSKMGNFRALIDLDRGESNNFNWEQAPNPENRVELRNDWKDIFGDPLIHLTWNMKPADWETLKTAVELTGKALVAAKYAKSYEFVKQPVEKLLMGDHPMGTTRMADNQADGVVDRNCRVHEVANVYVASSSVFPNAGWSNPTLTIVALAARLTGHIAERPDL